MRYRYTPETLTAVHATVKAYQDALTPAPDAAVVAELVELVEDDFENTEATGELLHSIRNEYGVDTARAVIHEVGYSTDLGALHFAQLLRDHLAAMAAARGMTVSAISERRILDLAS